MGGWFRKEIKTVDDLKGLKFRIAGMGGHVLARLGIVPQQIAGGDVYSALEKGSLDAAEFVGPYDDEKLGFHKVAKYYYYPGWWEGGAMLHMIVNDEKWNALPKQYQAILSQAGAAAGAWMIEKYDSVNPAALKRLIAGGAELRAFPQPVLEACYQATQEHLNEIAEKSALFKKTKESHDAYMKEVLFYTQIGENYYDNYPARQDAQGLSLRCAGHRGCGAGTPEPQPRTGVDQHGQEHHLPVVRQGRRSRGALLRQDLSRQRGQRGSSRPQRLSQRQGGGCADGQFTVAGVSCLGLNGGPMFKHNEAFSFQIATEDQDETDRYWNAIIGERAGQVSACGWCKDKWGISWQITPRVLTEVARRRRRGSQARLQRDDGR